MIGRLLVVVIAAGLAAVVVQSLPDIIRYKKMRDM